jgi:hypothetical protein
VLLNVFGSDGTSLLGTLPGEESETVGEVFGRARAELGFGGDGPVCLSRRIRDGGTEGRASGWESIPESATLGEIAIDEQADVSVDEDARLGKA